MRNFGKAVLALGLVGMIAAPAWAQGQGRGGFGGGFGGGGGTMLLSNKGVQQELKASSEQASKLDALAEEMRGKQREEMAKLQDAPQDQRREKMTELSRGWNAEINKSLAAVLKPEQLKRFHQIQTQSAGTMALTMAHVEEALKLTDDQKSKVREINEQVATASRDLRQSFQDDREGAMKKMAELRKSASNKVLALFTDAQKTTWKDLTGEPYEVRFEPRPQN